MTAVRASSSRSQHAKRVSIAGRSFTINGDPRDRYFRECAPDGGRFGDAPVLLAERYCGPRAVVVDAGANIGLTTLGFAHIARQGRVVAIEASGTSFGFLVENLERNRIENVLPIRVALSNTAGSVRLLEDEGFMAGTRIMPLDAATTAAGVEVPASTLDDVIERAGVAAVDLVKIDVEGHEPEVLAGAAATLARHRPLCIVEFNAYTMVYHRGAAPRDFLAQLKGIFPRIYRFDRLSGEVDDIAGRDEEFLAANEAGGFVDDLVCAFAELPVPRRRGLWTRIVRRLARP